MDTRISQYEIIEKLRGSGEPVVFKILKPDAATEDEQTRFRREFSGPI